MSTAPINSSTKLNLTLKEFGPFIIFIISIVFSLGMYWQTMKDLEQLTPRLEKCIDQINSIDSSYSSLRTSVNDLKERVNKIENTVYK